MVALIKCNGTSESNFSMFFHCFSSRMRASTSAGDFLNCCCNYNHCLLLFFNSVTCSNAGCITVVANFFPIGDFSSNLCGVVTSFPEPRACLSGFFMERETVRKVYLSSSPNRLSGLCIASLDATRGLTVRLSSVLLTSIRRRA